jgi:ribosomal protein L7/L12
LPAAVLEALQRGKLIEAVKLLRASGIGLKEARDALAAHVGAAAPPTVKPAPDFSARKSAVLPPDVIQALQQGHKIEAIKLLRNQTGLGLKEAKDTVDAYSRIHVMPAEGLSPGEVPKSAAGRWWLAAVAACVVGWYILRRIG